MKGVRNLLSLMIHRCRAKPLTMAALPARDGSGARPVESHTRPLSSRDHGGVYSAAVRTITIRSASQVGKSTIMTNCLGCTIDRRAASL